MEREKGQLQEPACLSVLGLLSQSTTEREDVNNRNNSLTENSRRQKSNIQVWAGKVPSEASDGESIPSLSPGFSWLPTVLGTPWLLCHPESASVFTHASPRTFSVFSSVSIEDSSHWIRGPPYI